jgi:Nickel responsive protein SCO4226-like
MPEFLLERYFSRGGRDAVEADAGRARRAAEELGRGGTPVRYVRRFFVPDEETCFFLYEADAAEHVHEAARQAGLSCYRVVQVASEPTLVPQPGLG